MSTTEASQDLDQPIQVPISEIESFIQESQERDDAIVANDVDVAKILFIISKLELRLDRLKNQKSQFLDWFKNQQEQVEGQIDFLKGHLQGYVETQPETKVQTPNGTAYITRRESIQWADDDTLLEYSKNQHLPVRIKEAPDKTELTKHYKETGQLPEGCTVEESKSLSIRR